MCFPFFRLLPLSLSDFNRPHSFSARDALLSFSRYEFAAMCVIYSALNCEPSFKLISKEKWRIFAHSNPHITFVVALLSILCKLWWFFGKAFKKRSSEGKEKGHPKSEDQQEVKTKRKLISIFLMRVFPLLAVSTLYMRVGVSLRWRFHFRWTLCVLDQLN